MIDKLDGRRAQVLVESLIVEVNANKLAEFGIQWQGVMGKQGDGTIGVIGTNSGAAGANILGITSALASGNAGEAALVGIRPSDLRPAAAGEAAVSSRVHLIEPLGDVTVVSVEAGGETLRMVLPEQGASGMKPGDTVPITIDLSKIHIFRAASGQVMT